MKDFIKVVKGHLTQTEKRHLQAIFDVKRQNASINRKSYYISKTDIKNVFKVSVKEMLTIGFSTKPTIHINYTEFTTNRNLNYIN